MVGSQSAGSLRSVYISFKGVESPQCRNMFEQIAPSCFTSNMYSKLGLYMLLEYNNGSIRKLRYLNL